MFSKREEHMDSEDTESGRILCIHCINIYALHLLQKLPAPHMKTTITEDNNDIIILSMRFRALRPAQEHQRQHWQS
jgi:hypothetical protein